MLQTVAIQIVSCQTGHPVLHARSIFTHRRCYGKLLYIFPATVILAAAEELLASNRSMKRKQIDSKEASVAATFYEPVYQRLRLWHRGQDLNLLCFVKPVGDPVAKLLSDCGAELSPTFRAKCFSGVWELPAEKLFASRFGQHPAQLDQTISEALGCQSGTCSAAAGLIQWGDVHDQTHQRRRIQSRLLVEASASQRRIR